MTVGFNFGDCEVAADWFLFSGRLAAMQKLHGSTHLDCENKKVLD
jgi:hypothetical protein